jgi:hypothetical protein
MAWLSVYAWFSCSSFVASALLSWGRGLSRYFRRGVPSQWRTYLRDAPRPNPAITTGKAVLLRPLQRFHFVTRRAWSVGYFCYHTALLSVLTVYGWCAVAVLVRSMQSVPLPSYTGLPADGFGRVVSLILGSGDPALGAYLFGSYRHLFRAFGWCELGVAMTGNVALLIGWFSEIPRRKPSHLLVRTLIFAIIQTEWLGRLQLVNWATGLHTVLGLTLLLMAPYCYLAHIYLAPLVMISAWRRHRRGSTA